MPDGTRPTPTALDTLAEDEHPPPPAGTLWGHLWPAGSSPSNSHSKPSNKREGLNISGPVSPPPTSTQTFLAHELQSDHANANKHLLVEARIEVEQGWGLLRLLVILGGIASCINALVVIVLDFQTIGIIACYQAAFAFITVLFEVPPGSVHDLGALGRLHTLLKDKASFLCDMLSRGVFYIFQGTIWLAICWALQTRGEHLDVHLICAVYMVFAGIITAIGHYAHCAKPPLEVGAEAALAIGPPVSGRTQNTEDRAQRRAEELGFGPEKRDQHPQRQQQAPPSPRGAPPSPHGAAPSPRGHGPKLSPLGSPAHSSFGGSVSP